MINIDADWIIGTGVCVFIFFALFGVGYQWEFKEFWLDLKALFGMKKEVYEK